MRCSKCGATVPDNSAFCLQCGAPMRQYAPQQPVYQQPVQPQRPAYQQPVQPQYQQPVQPQQPVYRPPVQQPAKPAVQPKENVGMGIVGAILGALVGGASIILFSQIGLVSALSGLLLAFGTLFGYEKLAGKISVTGVMVCLFFMAITPYLADRLDWAILIVREMPEYGLLEAFRSVHDLVMEDAYTENLLMIYGFTALGAVGTVIRAFKK